MGEELDADAVDGQIKSEEEMKALIDTIGEGECVPLESTEGAG